MKAIIGGDPQTRGASHARSIFGARPAVSVRGNELTDDGPLAARALILIGEQEDSIAAWRRASGLSARSCRRPVSALLRRCSLPRRSRLTQEQRSLSLDSGSFPSCPSADIGTL